MGKRIIGHKLGLQASGFLCSANNLINGRHRTAPASRERRNVLLLPWRSMNFRHARSARVSDPAASASISSEHWRQDAQTPTNWVRKIGGPLISKILACVHFRDRGCVAEVAAVAAEGRNVAEGACRHSFLHAGGGGGGGGGEADGET